MKLKDCYIIVLQIGLHRSYWKGWSFTDFREDAAVYDHETATIVLQYAQQYEMEKAKTEGEYQIISVGAYFSY